MDGVPDLTQAAVPNGQTFAYDFVVPDAGTYWFHSHVGTQLDRGLYGPLIIEDPDERVDYNDELVVVLDDWIDGTGTNPDLVLEKLRKTGMAMSPGGPGVTPDDPTRRRRRRCHLSVFPHQRPRRGRPGGGGLPSGPTDSAAHHQRRLRHGIPRGGAERADEGRPDRRLPGRAGTVPTL